jgi:hypothetical protein
MVNQQFNDLRQLTFEFMREQDLEKEWDEFVQEKQNAVQEIQQEAEEVSESSTSEE